jgi:hypothetical protein
MARHENQMEKLMLLSRSRSWLLGSAAAIALLAMAGPIATHGFAQEWQGPQGGQGQGQGGGGQGGGSQGGGGGEHEDSEHDEGEHEDGGGKGGHTPIGGGGQGAGQGSDGQGGSPVWSREGIPEVELGRLNVIRSPDRVLDRALAEVISTFDPATMEALYELSAAQFAAEAEANWGTITIIDSPLQNLALLRELWTTGETSLPQVDPRNLTELSAIFLGVASDKTIPISEEAVRALAIIIGVQMSDATIASIADKAEDVRLGVLAGHG